MSLLFVRESEMMLGSLSNSTSMSEEASGSSVLNPMFPSQSPQQQQEEKIRKKRNLPGNPDPESEVVALSPKTLMTTNRFVCEICNKGFQRDQNLQLHRRGHNLPWKLKQRNNKEYRKKVYVCPEPSCVHHNPSRALGDLTGIKKHFCRKHGEKKWRCEKCSKKYAVQSDYKAHMKTCGTKEYRCDCGTVFSRKDSFITHRAFCDALAQESARLTTTTNNNHPLPQTDLPPFRLNTQNPSSSILSFSTHFPTHHHQQQPSLDSWNHPPHTQNPSSSLNTNMQMMIKPEFSPMADTISSSPLINAAHNSNFPRYPNMNVTSNTNSTTAHLSATAMLLQAANVPCGATPSQSVNHHMVSSSMRQLNGLSGLDGFESARSIQMGNNNVLPIQHYMGFNSENLTAWQQNDRATRDFLGLAVGECGNDAGNVNVRELLSFTGAVDFQTYDHDHSMLKPPAPGFGFC